MKPRSYLSQEQPIRLAHRGSSILWPENTMAAFQGAVDLGYRYIETDAHVTRDGILVIFHDDRLDRVTNGKGFIKEWQWEDLRKLDAAYNFNPGSGFPLRGEGLRIPGLEEAMTAFPQVLFNIDLKQPGMEEAMAGFIKRHGFEERVLIASFFDGPLRRFRQLSGFSVATAAARWEVAAFWACSRFNKSLDLGADALQVPRRMRGITLVDEKFIQAGHAAGLQVHAWTIDEPAEMRQLLDLGVDGIITNRPDLLDKVLSGE
jgi:glycerophosphoryl diester phosphodiesterase